MQIIEINLFGLNSSNQTSEIAESSKLNDKFLESPPLFPIPIEVLNQEYIFYG